MIRIGIVGLGYWGPNLVRCFSELENCKVTAVCDQSHDQLLRITNRFPGVHPVENFETLLDCDMVDAVVIATPTSTHYKLARKALEHDLHVFVEKPLARTSDECRKLVDLANERIGCCLSDTSSCTQRPCSSCVSWCSRASWEHQLHQ
ncbi:MAG: Gfo/Idh/MocA family oxidoreductase [Pirellulaceae bacterium]